MGFIENLFKIARGLTANDNSGTNARDAAQGINDNFDAVNNALEQIDTATEKQDNKVQNLDAPNHTTYPTSQAAKIAIDAAEQNAKDHANGLTDSFQATSEKGQANGYTPLGSDGIVPSVYLPGAVDEIVEGAYVDATTFNDSIGNPVTPGQSKIYLDTSTSKQYRWGGTVYTEIKASPGTTDDVPEGALNKYFTEARVRAVVLTGLSTVQAFAISATDTLLVAIGKLQGQINVLTTTVGQKLDKDAYTGTAQDLKDEIDTKITSGQAQTLINQSETTAMDKRLANLAADLTTNEQDVIKTKLNITDGGTPQTPADYTNMADLFANQGDQSEDTVYRVENASAHSEITHTGWAEFKKLATSNAEEEDYELWDQEDVDVGFTAISENQYGTHPAFTNQNDLNVWLLQNSGGGTPTVNPVLTVNNIATDSFDYQIT